jgi:hypothetical protein
MTSPLTLTRDPGTTAVRTSLSPRLLIGRRELAQPRFPEPLGSGQDVRVGLGLAAPSTSLFFLDPRKPLQLLAYRLGVVAHRRPELNWQNSERCSSVAPS